MFDIHLNIKEHTNAALTNWLIPVGTFFQMHILQDLATLSWFASGVCGPTNTESLWKWRSNMKNLQF